MFCWREQGDSEHSASFENAVVALYLEAPERIKMMQYWAETYLSMSQVQSIDCDFYCSLGENRFRYLRKHLKRSVVSDKRFINIAGWINTVGRY